MFVCAKCGKDHAEGAATCDACGGPVLPVRQADDTLTGRMLVDKYVLLEELGEGGMGSVYRAKQRHLERLVAVKVLRLTHAKRKEALRRFYAEAKFTSQLQHPHNAKIFDFGHTDDGLIFIAMELVSGVPLARLPMPMSSRRLLRIADQICGALGEAHTLGLVHRDLKPDNVMVSKVDGRDFVRVLDYGIAKLENSSTGLTEQGRVIGTPQYMSPEQIAGTRLDARSPSRRA